MPFGFSVVSSSRLIPSFIRLGFSTTPTGWFNLLEQKMTLMWSACLSPHWTYWSFLAGFKGDFGNTFVRSPALMKSDKKNVNESTQNAAATAHSEHTHPADRRSHLPTALMSYCRATAAPCADQLMCVPESDPHTLNQVVAMCGDCLCLSVSAPD